MNPMLQTRALQDLSLVRGNVDAARVERTPAGSSLVEVLDRVLDKGVVIDAWLSVSLAGIDLITVEARIVVASIETHLRYGSVIDQL